VSRTAQELRGQAADGASAKAKGAAPAAKGKRKLVVAALLALVVVAAAGFAMKGKLASPHYRPGTLAPDGSVYGLPQLTTNLSDGHLVQIGLSLQLSSVANPKAVAADEAHLVDVSLDVLGHETSTALLAPGGKTQLKAALLGAYRSVLGPKDGVPQVNGVYFTSFLVQ
jgi:flagellar basal body-associated protein FliL